MKEKVRFGHRIINYVLPAFIALIIYTIIAIIYPDSVYYYNKLNDTILAFPISIVSLFIFSWLISFPLKIIELKVLANINRVLLFFIRMITYLVLVPLYLSINYPIVSWFLELIKFRGFH